ncbi:unnamed protein product, partial [Brenthis ino]
MIRPLPKALQEKAEKELFEKPNRIPSDILALREWLKKQPHLQSVNPTDQFLVAFLRGNKYSLERSKEKLDMLYTLRAVVPEIFRDRNPFDPIIQEILQLGILFPLDVCVAEDSCKLIYWRLGLYNPSKHKMSDFLKVVFMIAEILILEDDNYVVAGEMGLTDFKGVGLGTFLQFTPALAQKLVTCIEKAFPLRMKGIYIIHTPSGFETAFQILKTFLGDKLKNRFQVIGKNIEQVYSVFPKEVLPKEYGGKTRSLDELTAYWKAKVESYQDWFLEQDKQYSDESLRPDKPRTSSTLFGVEGSFRKLEVD